jgi:hypothetical protein
LALKSSLKLRRALRALLRGERSLYPWSQLAIGVERLREGAMRGGHPDRLPEIHPSVPVVVAATDANAREGAAWFVSFYVTTMGTIYRDSLTRQGDRCASRGRGTGCCQKERRARGEMEFAISEVNNRVARE